MDGYPYAFECIITQDKPTEYFCRSCKQLRLSFIADKTKCGNCGGTDLVHGDVGTLDKVKLLAGGNA